VRDTICAISTPPGIGGIAVLRVSGPDAVNIVSKILYPPVKAEKFKPNTLFHSFIKDPDKDEILDEAVISFMKAPHSYTGEDVVEISVHGGRLVPKLILELLIKQGARLAEPGEFTKRAFLNGKLDLIQARSVLDLIEARSRRGVRIALEKLRGLLSRRLEELRDKLLYLLKQIEARVEFEEDVPPLDETKLKEELVYVKNLIDKYVEEGERGALYFEGIEIAIVGKPNVGKSTLFNKLLRYERAIVTPYAGTTRDVISEEIIIEGVPVKLHDTAGIRETRELIESIGIERAKRVATSAHLVLFVIDASQEIDEDDINLWNLLEGERILVLNKIDLGIKVDLSKLKNADRFKTYLISCITGEGLEELETGIKEDIHQNVEVGGEFALSQRERALLLEAGQEIASAIQGLGGIPLDLISFHVSMSLRKLNEIFGIKNIPEEILNSIFKDFCIGK